MSEKVIVAFDRFGPYHIARLRHLSECLKLTGKSLIAIEYVQYDNTYDWAIEKSDQDLNRQTLFVDYTKINKKVIYDKLDNLSPDYLFVPGWGDVCSRALIRWSKKNCVPFYLMSDSAEADEPRVWWKESVKRFIIRGCSGAIVAGDVHKSYLEKLGLSSSNIVKGYDVVDNEYFTKKSIECNKNREFYLKKFNLPSSYFLGIGRFVEKKNFKSMIIAYSQVNKEFKDFPNLVIVGDGELRNEYLKLINDFNLQDKVQLVGFKQYSEIPIYYSLSTAVIVPSYFEQWGLVVNEALACGVPVLCSERCGAAADLIEHQNCGLLFDPLSVDDLVNTLKTFFMVRDKEVWRKNCLSSVERFGLKTFSNSIIHLIS